MCVQLPAITPTSDLGLSKIFLDRVSAHVLGDFHFVPYMKPISNIVYQIQYLTMYFILDLQESIYKQVKKTYYMSAGFAGRHVVCFGNFSIDVFLEVQNKRYSKILYLIDYIAYELHLWYKICIFKEICRKPISLHPGLATSLQRT